MIKRTNPLKTENRHVSLGELEVGEMVEIADFTKGHRYDGTLAIRAMDNKIIILDNGHIFNVRCNLFGRKLISKEEVILIQP